MERTTRNSVPPTTFITTCMGRLGFLKQSLPTVVAQPHSSCIVVDYSCPERAGAWVSENFPQVKVVHVEGQSRFNVAVARNAGLAAASDRWICCFDSDVLFAPSFMETVGPQLAEGFYYRADPLTDPGLHGTIIASRQDIERAGGYDATYQGWGEEDLDFVAALEFVGLKKETFPASLLAHIPHGDQVRTQFYQIKDYRLSLTVNHIYGYIKWDIIRLTHKQLSHEKRVQLHRNVVHAVARSGSQKDPDVTFKLTMNDVTPLGYKVDRVLNYLFRLP